MLVQKCFQTLEPILPICDVRKPMPLIFVYVALGRLPCLFQRSQHCIALDYRNDVIVVTKGDQNWAVQPTYIFGCGGTS